MKIGKLEVDLTELQKFIVDAGKKGYAGGGEKIREKFSQEFIGGLVMPK